MVENLPNVRASVNFDSTDCDESIRFVKPVFFTEQSVKGAAVYLLRKILYDWRNEKAVQILRCLKPALKRGARISVQDFYVPDLQTSSRWRERRLR